MALFTADYYCDACEHRFDEVVDRDAREQPQSCPVCGEASRYVIGAPTVLKASFPDGTKRHDLRRIAEASKIEAASYDLPHDKRGAHDKEIAALTRAGGKK